MLETFSAHLPWHNQQSSGRISPIWTVDDAYGGIRDSTASQPDGANFVFHDSRTQLPPRGPLQHPPYYQTTTAPGPSIPSMYQSWYRSHPAASQADPRPQMGLRHQRPHYDVPDHADILYDSSKRDLPQHSWYRSTELLNDPAFSLDARANPYHAPSDDRFFKPDGLHRARSDRSPHVQPMPLRHDSRLLPRNRSGHPFSQSIDLVQPILLPTAHPRHSYHHDPYDNVIIYAASPSTSTSSFSTRSSGSSRSHSKKSSSRSHSPPSPPIPATSAVLQDPYQHPSADPLSNPHKQHEQHANEAVWPPVPQRPIVESTPNLHSQQPAPQVYDDRHDQSEIKRTRHERSHGLHSTSTPELYSTSRSSHARRAADTRQTTAPGMVSYKPQETPQELYDPGRGRDKDRYPKEAEHAQPVLEPELRPSVPRIPRRLHRHSKEPSTSANKEQPIINSSSTPELRKVERPSLGPRPVTTSLQPTASNRQRRGDLDRIDELDESDPFNFYWHNDSRYEAVTKALPFMSQDHTTDIAAPDVGGPSLNVKPGEIMPANVYTDQQPKRPNPTQREPYDPDPQYFYQSAPHPIYEPPAPTSESLPVKTNERNRLQNPDVVIPGSFPGGDLERQLQNHPKPLRPSTRPHLPLHTPKELVMPSILKDRTQAEERDSAAQSRAVAFAPGVTFGPGTKKRVQDTPTADARVGKLLRKKSHRGEDGASGSRFLGRGDVGARHGEEKVEAETVVREKRRDKEKEKEQDREREREREKEREEAAKAPRRKLSKRRTDL